MAIEPRHAGRIVKRKVCRGIVRYGFLPGAGNPHARRRELE